ncbi:MAG: APC family permease [Methanomicrobiales archaeon]|nr:APC family permease [Methanomicrobiales archaeon]
MAATGTVSGVYRRSLGLFELVALGIGGTVGSGIFVVPGLAAAVAGSSSIWIWVLVAFSATCTLLCLRWTTSRFPGTGAFYSIFRPLFGKKAATILVIVYLISTIFGISTIAAGLGQYLFYLGLSHLLIVEVLLITCFCMLNIRGIYLSGITENILTVLKIIPLFIITILLIPRISPSNLLPFPSLGPRTFIQGILLIYWPFTGFEISAIPADEIADKRMIGRSLVIVMAIVIGLYLSLNLSLLGALGSTVLAQSPAPLATAAELLLPMGGTFVAMIGVIAMISALNAYLVGGSRVLQNLAEEHAVSPLRSLNHRGAPQIALIICSVFSAGLLLVSNHFGELAAISVITTLIPYLFIGAAAFLLFPYKRFRIVSFFSVGMTAVILMLSLIPLS